MPVKLYIPLTAPRPLTGDLQRQVTAKEYNALLDFMVNLQQQMVRLNQGTLPSRYAWTTTNYTASRSVNAGTVTLPNLANAFCTAIEDMKARGDFRGVE